MTKLISLFTNQQSKVAQAKADFYINLFQQGMKVGASK